MTGCYVTNVLVFQPHKAMKCQVCDIQFVVFLFCDQKHLLSLESIDLTPVLSAKSVKLCYEDDLFDIKTKDESRLFGFRFGPE